MKLKDHLFILFIIFALFGSLVTIQIRSTVSMQRESAATLNLDRLKEQLDSNIKAGEAYKTRIVEVETKIQAFLEALPETNTNNNVQSQLEYLRLISGQTDVKGEGVIITLNDAEKPDSDSISDFIIHDSDVLTVVNELRKAGAQAISINNERIMATSEQLCAGPTIKINNNRYAVPYEIKAIGNADKMYVALKESSIMNELVGLKKRVTLKQGKEIIIPKFRNDINSLISRLEVINNETKKNK